MEKILHIYRSCEGGYHFRETALAHPIDSEFTYVGELHKMIDAAQELELTKDNLAHSIKQMEGKLSHLLSENSSLKLILAVDPTKLQNIEIAPSYLRRLSPSFRANYMLQKDLIKQTIIELHSQPSHAQIRLKFWSRVFAAEALTAILIYIANSSIKAIFHPLDPPHNDVLIICGAIILAITILVFILDKRTK